MRSEILTVMTVKNAVCWAMTSCKPVDAYQYLGEFSCLYCKGRYTV